MDSAQAWAPAPHVPRLGGVPCPPLLAFLLGPLKEEFGGRDLEMDSPKAVSAGHQGGPHFPQGPGLPNISTRLGVGPPVCAMHSWCWGPSPLTYQAAETCSPLAGSPHPSHLPRVQACQFDWRQQDLCLVQAVVPWYQRRPRCWAAQGQTWVRSALGLGVRGSSTCTPRAC